MSKKTNNKAQKKSEWIPVKSTENELHKPEDVTRKLPKSFPIPKDAQIIAYCPQCKKIIFSEKYETNTPFLLGLGGGVGGITKNYSPSYPVAHEIKCPIGMDSHYCQTLYTF